MKYILIIVCSFIGILKSIACSCGELSSIEGEYSHSGAIFIGQVIRIEEPEPIFTSPDSVPGVIDSSFISVRGNFSMEIRPYKIITFLVKELFKGDLTKTITVKTGRCSMNCGVDFEKNKQYLIYANWQQDASFGEAPYWYTSSCYRTKPSKEAGQEREILRTLKKKD
jgi:hypothetical protein